MEIVGFKASADEVPLDAFAQVLRQVIDVLLAILGHHKALDVRAPRRDGFLLDLRFV